MSETGITATGFNRKRLDVLLAELNTEVKAVFGENLNLSPESPDGQINGVVSESNANLWELAELAYNAGNPATATGVALSNLVTLNGLTRLAASAATASLTVTGTAATVIPLGSKVSIASGEQFATDVAVTLDGSGNGVVASTAVVTGELIASAGTITTIDTPITGWSTVTNAVAAKVGSNLESDAELRARRNRSTSTNSQSVIDSIYSAVGNVSGVTQTAIVENDTTATVDGIPAHAFQVVALGGVDADIAKVIFLKKPAGIQAFGSTVVAVNDSQGVPHNIGFSRPTSIPIYVSVTVSKTSTYPANGDDLIKQAIVDYANGILVTGEGFSLGDDVIYTRLYTPINSIQGHQVTVLNIGVSPTPTGTVNIVIASTQLSSFTTANITVSS